MERFIRVESEGIQKQYSNFLVASVQIEAFSRNKERNEANVNKLCCDVVYNSRPS